MVESAVKRDDGWNWPFILYTGMNWLGYSEAEVWQLTPAKWESLVTVYLDLYEKKWGMDNSAKTSVQPKEPVTQTAYIDQIRW